MLLSDTVGNAPVASVYKVPICLLTSTAKQKTLFAPLDAYSSSLSWQSASAWKIDVVHLYSLASVVCF